MSWKYLQGYIFLLFQDGSNNTREVNTLSTDGSPADLPLTEAGGSSSLNGGGAAFQYTLPVTASQEGAIPPIKSLGAPPPTGYALSLAAAASPMGHGATHTGNIRDTADESRAEAGSDHGAATKQLTVANGEFGDNKSRLKKVATRKFCAADKRNGVKDLYDYTLEDIIR